MLKIYILLITLLFITTNSIAAETTTDADKSDNAWKGNIELGYVKTSGNTETESLNTKANAEKDGETWRHKLNLEALKSSDDGTTTAERYIASGQSDYKLKGKKNFFFVFVSYEDDRFSGYDYQMTEAIGYGRRVLDDNNMTLDLEIGPGARQRKVEQTGDIESESLIRGAARYAWKITDHSKFSEDLTVEASKDTTISKSVTALSAKINTSLATKVTYTVKNTSKVPPGIKKVDTELAVTLVYGF